LQAKAPSHGLQANHCRAVGEVCFHRRLERRMAN
jgi:hypothetical protein